MRHAVITLRSATQDDWRAIASLLEDGQLPRDGAREHLGAFLLAVADGVVVGCACTEAHAEVALLRSIAVAPTLRRQGIGTMLINGLVQDAKRRKTGKIYLLTTSAEEYFANFGFRREPIEQAPRSLQDSALFQGACPASAALMSLCVGE
ncbi:GCN5-related N-acetyltransferase [Burkholderiales bacterium]|nr:GCN5-related N-acetyltransferase [Burkholderiales bacterium]